MIRTIFFPHVAAAIVVTGICLLVYAAVQQQYRTAANDPQIQVARDIMMKLKQNTPAGSVVPADTIDPEQSLISFVQVYGANNNLLASNGYIGSQAPAVPAGVLEKARQDGEYMVTWQPTSMARIASVVTYTGGRQGSYVVVGRSLLEVEKRESALLKMVFVCWVCCMGVICAHGALQAYLSRKVA
jgi:hypothetical protein